MVLTINNTDYKIHYGYKVVAKYGILKESYRFTGNN